VWHDLFRGSLIWTRRIDLPSNRFFFICRWADYFIHIIAFRFFSEIAQNSTAAMKMANKGQRLCPVVEFSPDYIYKLKVDGERCVAYLNPQEGTDLRNKRNIKMLPKVPELEMLHEYVERRCYPGRQAGLLCHPTTQLDDKSAENQIGHKAAACLLCGL